MKENELDIQVRNLMQGAQESVSPSVWEGVQAGLARKRRAAAFWRWTGAVAAAAAMLAGVVLLRPVAQQEHSNPIILAESSAEGIPQAPLVQEEAFPAEGSVVVTSIPARRTVRLAQAVPAPAVQEVEEMPQRPVAEEAVEANVPDAVSEPAPAKNADMPAVQEADDQALLNRLAYEQEKTVVKRPWSVAVSGNLQDKRRGAVSSLAPRQYAAPALSAPEGIYNESPELSFSLPFSAGIGINWQFLPRWAVGTGVRYTNLSRMFVGDYKGNGFVYSQTDIDNHQHWLGVPLNLYYQFVNRGRWRVHTFASGTMEFLVDNDYLVHGPQKDIHYHRKGSRPQFSAGLGLGVEFKLTPWLGLYLDPAFRYYFRPDLQPRSLRTIQPLRFDIEAGLRFNLGK